MSRGISREAATHESLAECRKTGCPHAAERPIPRSIDLWSSTTRDRRGSCIRRYLTVGVFHTCHFLSQPGVSCGSLKRATRPPNVQLQGTWYRFRGVAVVVVAQGKTLRPLSARKHAQHSNPEYNSPPQGLRQLMLRVVGEIAERPRFFVASLVSTINFGPTRVGILALRLTGLFGTAGKENQERKNRQNRDDSRHF
jgi:hypothetical protein